MRYAPALTKKQIKMEYYRCQDCSATICRKRRIDVRKYRCGRCHGEIKWIETKREDFNEAQKSDERIEGLWKKSEQRNLKDWNQLLNF